MSGYPNLHPAGFLERDEPCDGPRLYRGQPSRETGGVLLNDFLAKYNPSGNVTDYKFMETIKNLKEFSRQWPNIPQHVRNELLNILRHSNNDLANELNTEEHFAGHLKKATSSNDAKHIINNFIEHFAQDKDLTCVNQSQLMWISVLIAIVSIVISFLIFQLGR